MNLVEVAQPNPQNRYKRIISPNHCLLILLLTYFFIYLTTVEGGDPVAFWLKIRDVCPMGARPMVSLKVSTWFHTYTSVSTLAAFSADIPSQ